MTTRSLTLDETRRIKVKGTQKPKPGKESGGKPKGPKSGPRRG